MYIANKEVLESSKVKPFGMQDKVGYMLGDVGSCLLFNFIGSYLLVFPAIIIALGTIVVELLKDKLRKVSYILLIPAALITILYVPTVYLFNCALTFGALCATMIFAMFGIISVITCLVQID